MSGNLDWDRVAELFEQGTRMHPDERDAWLDAECGTDTALRAEVAALLEAASDSAGYLERLAEETVGAAARDAVGDSNALVAMPGRSIGGYDVIDVIGSGGMATVYLARDPRHNRNVALKVLRPELAATIGPERFLREIEIAARLAHPHILPVFDSGQSDGLLYYVMPHVVGESLRRRIRREGRLPIGEAVKLTTQVASALTHAHEQGVVHRDIKPENILLSGDQAIVVDFGIARALEAAGSDRLTGTGLAVGTPAYMSPEQALGSDAVDARSDVYALGCVVHEMLMGAPPFSGPTPQALLAQHAAHKAPAMRTKDPAIPVFVERAIERALAKDPADRFNTAAAFADVLTTGTIVARPRGRAHLKRFAITAAAAVMLVLTGWGVSTIALGPQIQRLAVLPLTSLSADAGQDYLVEGVHEALISEIAQLGVPVIARATMQRYRDSGMSISEIADELGVDAIIEASLFREGDTLEIAARMYDDREREIWADAYDGDLPNVVGLYRGLARAIAGQVRLELTPEHEQRLAAVETVDPAVYEAYLRGMYHLNQSTPDDFARAVDYFDAAVAANPADPLAYAGLALGYVTLGHGPAPPADAWRRGKAAAERAVRLDPTLAEGWAALADIKTYFEWDWENAERAFHRANELNPSLAMNHYHRAWFLVLHGRVEESLAAHRTAQQLDPLTPLHTVWIPGVYLYSGQYEKALSEARAMIDQYPDNGSLLYVLGTSAAQVGEYDEAIAAHERAVAVNPAWRAALGRSYALAGRTDDARRMLAELESEPPSAWGAIGLADLHTALGNFDEAFRWLSYEPAHGWLPWSRVNPALVPLRDDPRFAELMRRMNLAPPS